MSTPSFTLTTEQINSLPLLLGIITDMGIRELIDTHVTPHGNWEGASVGTLVSLWLSCLLQERDHRVVMVRDWAANRTQTLNQLLEVTLRPTDCTDDRLAKVLTMLGHPDVQAALDAALLQRWVRLYHLPTDTLRLDSTSVSVYHDPDEPTRLLQLGHSKDHRPDLRQFKVMLATLDPLGLPVVCPVVAGNCADDPLYAPTYDAAVAAVGTRAVLVVGDSKMAALATRAHIVAAGSCYLCAYRPPATSEEIAGWIETALQRAAQWQVVETVDETTGEITRVADLDVWEREQTWRDPTTQLTTTWTERVLVGRSAAYQAGLRRRREQALDQLIRVLSELWQPPGRGRKRYRSAEALEQVVAAQIARAKLTGIVGATIGDERLPNGTTRFVVTSIWVDRAAWQAMVDRLGWQIYVTNTTATQYDAPTLLEAYHDQPILERGFARLKTRNLQIRPVYLRDEQRIAGLVWLLGLALRVLTLTEYRVREALSSRQEAVVGLNPASRSQATTRPTTERVIAAFANITLTRLELATERHWHVTPLNATQRHILVLLKLPADLYERLANPVSNFENQLRE
jgi:transposase